MGRMAGLASLAAYDVDVEPAVEVYDESEDDDEATKDEELLPDGDDVAGNPPNVVLAGGVASAVGVDVGGASVAATTVVSEVDATSSPRAGACLPPTMAATA